MLLAALLALAGCSDSGGGGAATSGSGVLSAPSNITVNFVSETSLSVSWSAASGAESYKIYRSEDENDTDPELLTETYDCCNYTDEANLDPYSTYWYWLSSCTSVCSGRSDPHSGFTGEDIFPSDFAATAGLDSVTLDWSANEGYDYELYRAQSDCISSLADLANYASLCAGHEPNLTTEVTPPVTQDGLSSDIEYYYWLKVSNSDGAEDYNEQAIAVTPLDSIRRDPGTEVWTFFFSDTNAVSPTIDATRDTVYMASSSDLYAFDTDTGDELWEDPFRTAGVITAPPIVDNDGNIYLVSSDGDTGSVIYKLDQNGETLWDPLTVTYVGQASALVEISEYQSLYYGNSNGEVFRNSNLSRRDSSRIYLGDNSNIRNAIVVDMRGYLFFSSNNLTMDITDADGEHKADIDLTKQVVGVPALGNNSAIYFAADQRVYAYNVSGSKKWESGTINEISGSVVLGVNSGGSTVVYVGGGDSTLYAFDGESGNELWNYPLGSSVSTTAPVVDSDGNIYIGTAGRISVVDNAGNLVNTYTLTGSSSVSTPLKLSSDGVLYFGAGRRLYAIQGEAGINTESAWPEYKGNARNTGYMGDSLAADENAGYAQEQLDNEDLIFSGDWQSTTNYSVVGDNSMRSSDSLGHLQESCITTYANKTGTLSFSWRVDSEAGYDHLSLQIGDEDEKSDYIISGEVDWTAVSGILVNDSVQIMWCYSKDNSVSDGLDAGWLDNVQIQ